ncbi:MAG: hypothetical protein KDA28_03260 [Phycisphaerales bacterium]|nr:hypothetical protein [Phycisphaerales bacterium]
MKQRVLLTLFVMSPVVVVAILTWLIAISLDRGPDMTGPRLGAGAGDTGGANALGEYFGHHEAEVSPDIAPVSRIERVPPESLEQGFIIVVRDDADLAGPTSPVYVASNHVNWNPASASMKMSPRSDMRWQLIVEKPESDAPLAFKFTRRDWSNCDVTYTLEDAPTRTLPLVDPTAYADGSKPIFEFTVPAWADQRASATPVVSDTLDVTGDVRRLEVAGGAGDASATTRDLLVWLPPGYDETRTYPVLYLHDGQHVFTTVPGTPGEWRVDETLTHLISLHAVEPVVVVAIPNAGAARSQEYLPFDHKGIRGMGDEYLAWFMREVRPRVERAFRVRTDREGIAMGGASLGAVITLHAAMTHPDIIGSVILESMPPLRESGWDEHVLASTTWPDRMFIGMGTKEWGDPARDQDWIEWATMLERSLSMQGVGPERRLLVIAEDASHDERAWAERFPDAAQFLFAPGDAPAP